MISSNAHRSHDRAVDVVERRFVGGEQTVAFRSLHGFFRNDVLRCHDLVLRFNAGRIIVFHVPNVGMTLPLNLLFGLAYGGAEAVVDLLVDAIARFVPDEIRDRIDGGVEELVGLPEVGLELSIGLPFLEMESEQRIVKWRLPEIKEEARCFVELANVSAGSYQDDIGAAFTLCRYAAHKLRRLGARTRR